MIVKPGIPSNLQWYQDARYGFMIHFGVYAQLGRGEWVMYREGIRKREYEQLAAQFNPNKFKADEWVELAVHCGCRYMIFTSKHHDGFCLFDSAYTDYKITNTPFGRDLMGELIESCHRHDMPIVIYYSQPDWHHINYVNWPGAFKDLAYEPEGQEPDWSKYQQYLFHQIEEICTKYGKIDGIFFDGSHKSVNTWRGDELYALIKRHQPDAVVNDRARCGDMFTPERTAVELIDRGLANTYLLEICTSVTKNGWGYAPRSDLTSITYHIEQMVKAARIGCNYALNVGPAPDGTIPRRCQVIYERIGDWLARHDEGYIGTQAVYPELDDNRYVMLKQAANVYLFCLKWPDVNRIEIPGVANGCKRVTLMSTGQDISFEKQDGVLSLYDLPLAPPDGLVQAFKIELDGKPNIAERQPRAITQQVLEYRSGMALTPETAFMQGYGVKGCVLKAARMQEGEMSSGEADDGEKLSEVFITGWMTPDQHASWQIKTLQSMDCEAAVQFNLQGDYPGAILALTINGMEIQVAVPCGRRGVTNVPMGKLHLNEGLNEIDIHAASLKWEYLFPPVGNITLK